MSLLSIVLPAYNEEDVIAETTKVISELLSNANIAYQLVFVDDGSSDRTWSKITDIVSENLFVKGVKLSRNFGKERAVLAGLSSSDGECVIVMDCDLQHPPHKIIEMYNLWKQGFKIVNGVKSNRGSESFFYKISAKLFYSIMSSVIDIDMKESSDFKLLDREVVDLLLSMPERNYFLRGMSEWIGFRSTSVEYDVALRKYGNSKWSTLSLIKYAITNISSFSSVLLHFITYLGLLAFFISVVIGFISLFKYVQGNAVEGFTTVIFLIIFMGSIIMISLGIIGFYVSKIYEEVKKRPRFIIEEIKICEKNTN